MFRHWVYLNCRGRWLVWRDGLISIAFLFKRRRQGRSLLKPSFKSSYHGGVIGFLPVQSSCQVVLSEFFFCVVKFNVLAPSETTWIIRRHLHLPCVIIRLAFFKEALNCFRASNRLRFPPHCIHCRYLQFALRILRRLVLYIRKQMLLLPQGRCVLISHRVLGNLRAEHVLVNWRKRRAVTSSEANTGLWEGLDEGFGLSGGSDIRSWESEILCRDPLITIERAPLGFKKELGV